MQTEFKDYDVPIEARLTVKAKSPEEALQRALKLVRYERISDMSIFDVKVRGGSVVPQVVNYPKRTPRERVKDPRENEDICVSSFV